MPVSAISQQMPVRELVCARKDETKRKDKTEESSLSSCESTSPKKANKNFCQQVLACLKAIVDWIKEKLCCCIFKNPAKADLKATQERYESLKPAQKKEWNAIVKEFNDLKKVEDKELANAMKLFKKMRKQFVLLSELSELVHTKKASPKKVIAFIKTADFVNKDQMLHDVRDFDAFKKKCKSKKEIQEKMLRPFNAALKLFAHPAFAELEAFEKLTKSFASRSSSALQREAIARNFSYAAKMRLLEFYNKAHKTNITLDEFLPMLLSKKENVQKKAATAFEAYYAYVKKITDAMN